MRGGSVPPMDAEARGRAASDLRSSICVEAGAGTGKTSLLVSRFLSIVESGEASCGEIVAITFTEKAAGEMKVRLREEIRARLSRDPAPEARANLEAAWDELERAPISTIHSFAATILREHPVEAGIDPDFTQLDALEGELFFDECWNDFLAAGSGPFADVLGRFALFGGSLVKNLREIAGSLYARRGERSCARLFARATDADPAAGSTDAAPGERSGAPEAGAGRASLREAFAEAEARLTALARDHCVNPEDRGKAAIEEFAGRMRGLERLGEDEIDYVLLTLPLPKGKGNQGNWDPAGACAEQKTIFKDLAALQSRERGRISDSIRDRLGAFFDEFLAFTARRKAALGVLDFDDLLIGARELCGRREALDELRGRYRYILVDEFQDTDPVQAEIVWLLAGSPGRGEEGRAERGKLFIVGDPKQSIYRFRKADIEMYERVKERLAEDGAVLQIRQNFRSVPGIVDWVNATFAGLMGRSGEMPFQAGYEPIYPHRPPEGPSVVRLDLELDDEREKAAAIREREGAAIARLIHRLIDEGTMVTDPHGGASRTLEYGDIAVIYPGTTGIDSYEDPLRAEGIPYVVEGGKLYYAREEVRDLAAAVWAIEDPYDTLALVATLRSPVFGASDEEIFLFTRAGGRLDYLAPGAEACGDFEGIAAALGLLAELHRARNERGPSGTMLELLRRTKYLELSLLRPHGEQRVSNIAKAVSSARAFEGKNGSYRRFARWFRDQETLASAESEGAVVEEETKAVRLLTVHKAKGLQFPVVILANLVQARRRSAPILVEGGCRLSFKLGLLETSDYASSLETEKARDDAETVRLLYVAATRAGSMLFIPRIPKAESYYGLLEDGLETEAIPSLALSVLPPLRGEAKPFVRSTEESAASRRQAKARREAWIADRGSLLDRARRAPAIVAPSRLAGEVVERRAEAARAPRPSRDRALLFGLAFHRIMELADLSSTRGLELLARSIASNLAIPEDAPELERLASRALGSEVIARAARSRRIVREAPFTLSREGGFVEGRIDLLFEEADGWTLVDYKTDDLDPAGIDGALAIYRPQAAVYALALRSLGIECAGGAVLFFVRPNVSRTIELSRALEEEARRLIHGALAVPDPG